MYLDVYKRQLLALVDKLTGGTKAKYKNRKTDHWSRNCLDSLCDKDVYKRQAYGNYSWNSNTKLLANFNDTLSGSNFDGSYENIDHFQVYKALGEQDTLHKVCQTENPTQRVIEDFAVGDLCDYQYYIFGIDVYKRQILKVLKTFVT